MKLAIKGHPTRGKEVIELLEMLGGKNIYNLIGTKEIWYILSNGTIEHSAYLFDEKGFTLEEFLKKFPYKIGDKVSSKYLKNYSIEKMEWKNTADKVIYKLQGQGWYSVEELQLYKEETMEEKLMPKIDFNDYCKDKYLLDLGNYEIKEENGKTYAVRKQPKYPKTFEECCKVIGINRHNIEIDLPRPYQQTMFNIFKLFICRNAYWKIAGEEKGLSKPWEPDWNSLDKKYNIYNYRGDIKYDYFTVIDRCLLIFPTAEIRDAFYKNFEELIEQCKELL